MDWRKERTAVASELPDGMLRTMVEKTAMPFVCIDYQGMIVYAGRSVSSVVEWAATDLLGRNIAEFVRVDDMDLAMDALAEIDSIDNMNSSVPVVLPLRLPDGGWRHVELAAMPLENEDVGEVVALRLRSWEQERHMSDFVRAMLQDGPLDRDLEALARSVAASLDSPGASVHYGFDGTSFHGVAGSWPGAASLPTQSTPWTEAVQSEGIVVIPAEAAVQRHLRATCGWLVAVHPSNAVPPAVLTVWRNVPVGPFLGHRRALSQARDFVELAVVRAAEHERLVHLARHDALTGVVNRAAFHEELAAAVARGEQDIAVGFCDLDGFKEINDRYGHSAGDEILVTMAQRLRAGLRAGDEVARLGGDEFTILWRNVTDSPAAHAVAQRIVEAGEQPFEVGTHTVSVTVSVGVALADAGATADSLIADADAALYHAKDCGGRTAHIHNQRP